MAERKSAATRPAPKWTPELAARVQRFLARVDVHAIGRGDDGTWWASLKTLQPGHAAHYQGLTLEAALASAEQDGPAAPTAEAPRAR